jgi:hypothetical protein
MSRPDDDGASIPATLGRPLTTVDWREQWRQRLSEWTSPLSGPLAGAAPAEPSDLVDEQDSARTRFYIVVARTRLDLFLTIRRQFLDDRTVYVMLDRREQEQDRRGRSESLVVPDRRQKERRRPRDYWEDTARHPAVLIPVTRLRQGREPRPPDDVREPDKEPTMDHVLVDEARARAWVQEGQHVLQHVLPTILGDRETLTSRLHEATRRCQELQDENAALRAQVARATADHERLEHHHADLADSVGRFLVQLTDVLEPMRALAGRLAQPIVTPGRGRID